MVAPFDSSRTRPDDSDEPFLVLLGVRMIGFYFMLIVILRLLRVLLRLLISFGLYLQCGHPGA